jgi:hypothetical protein
MKEIPYFFLNIFPNNRKFGTVLAIRKETFEK